MNWMAFGAWVVILHCVAFALWLASVVLGKFRCAAPSTTVAVAFFVSVATVVAQKNSPTNEPPRMAPMGGNAGLADPRKDLVPIGGVAMPLRTTGTSAFAASLNKVAKINTRGAWVDSFRLDFPDGFLFPYGTNHLSFVEVFTQGYVRPRRMTYEMLADIGTCGAIVPGLSSIAVEHTPSNSVRIAWEDAAANRNTNNLITAAIELFRNGNFSVETNGVATTTARVHPSDVDGDGLPDGVDPNPTVWDGDLFGPRNILPEGANSNAYCYVDLVVHGADAEVVFFGDGPSNLADPHFMARAEETNRVAILIGKGYEISADEPIECISVSDASIDVCQTSESTLYVRWPVAIECVDQEDPPLRSPGFLRGGSSGGISRTVHVVPDWLGGEFSWETNHCCEISMSDFAFAWACLGDCGCGGCQAHGWYVYEGYGLDVFGGECGCSPAPHEPEEPEPGPSISVSFSEDALFYEESYTNEPGVVVERRVSTNATLVCSAYGGTFGGVFGLSVVNLGKLSKVAGDDLPQESVAIAAGETRTWESVYSPLECSDAVNDITLTATFTENLSGDVVTNVAQLTVVKLELEPWVTKVGCEKRHLLGVGERVLCLASPDVGQWSDSGSGEIVSILAASNYVCPLMADGSVLRYSLGTSSYGFRLTFVEPMGIGAFSPVARDFGVARNRAGGAGMNLQVYVFPDTVAFSGIAMEEVPSQEGLHQGFFSNVFFSNVWYHTTAMNAGRWIVVSPDNYWGMDRAWMGDELPREMPNGDMTFDQSCGAWTDGLLVWDIPWGWGAPNSVSGTLPVKTMVTHYNQTFSIDEYGTLSVSKFLNVVSRGTNDVIRLNGNAVVGEPLMEEELNEDDGGN